MSLFKSNKNKAGGVTAETQAASGKPAIKTPAAQTASVSATQRLPYTILRKPLISEKALLGGARSQFVFTVDPKATKPAIRQEVERRYGVHVRAVNIVRMTGKQKHFRGMQSHKMVQKKAIVTLQAGEKIDVQ
jgi:large subunit ribosomal protein L23